MTSTTARATTADTVSGHAVRFVDLFAGMGGIRKGFETAFRSRGYTTECVMTSEIKPSARKVLRANHPDEEILGDIAKIDASSIPDFDFLLGGFPCQAFSFAGKRLGFEDTRGTLFFEVERILKEKSPFGFILENVEGLVTHDREDTKQPIGKTSRSSSTTWARSATTSVGECSTPRTSAWRKSASGSTLSGRGAGASRSTASQRGTPLWPTSWRAGCRPWTARSRAN